jgi:hypothetical protein
VLDAARRASLLGQRVPVDHLLGGEKFELAARGTKIDIDLKRARDPVGQVAQEPARLAKLELFACNEEHFLGAMGGR